jgi:carotenoid cleavage dioxygenase-like enzyme
MNPPLEAPAGADFRLGFTSLDREVQSRALPVAGTLPGWLNGTLFRNGPARFAVGAERYRHWFDGLAMLHRFRIANGTVEYGNRFLRSEAYVEAARIGRIARSEFDTDPAPTLAERLGIRFGAASSNNANVNIVRYGGGYLALTETVYPLAFDGDTLATRGPLVYADNVTGQMTTAHAHHDPVRRATFNIVTEFGAKSFYKIVRIADGTLTRTIVAAIPADEPAYIHAFSTTKNTVVVAEYPLVVRALDLMFRRKPFIENYRWKPARATRFHVIHKDSGAVLGTYETGAFFAFHHINAFEEGDAIVVDISAYDDAAIIPSLRLSHLLGESHEPWARATFRRYRLIPGRSTPEVELVVTASTELPSVARPNAGRDYRYAYGLDDGGTAGIGNQLVKVDVRERVVTPWTGTRTYPGEPVFVARPGATDEDDGVLVSVVLDAAAGDSFLLVLDAGGMHELARARVPHHIPFGFHGIFTAVAAGSEP